MNEFQHKVIAVLEEQGAVWIVGGAVRDKLLQRSSQDLDLVISLQIDEAEALLKDQGYHPQRLSKNFDTLTLFDQGSRLDIVHADNFGEDALRRDFTINAIYMHPGTEKIFDPLYGTKDLAEKRLRCCGNPADRFREDPVRVLRMIKFAVDYQLDIDNHTWDEAKEFVDFLAAVPRERVTAELAEILILEDAEKAVRLLEEIGYWDIFVPELARLKGIVQNQYHSLGVWEHTMAVFRNTPQDLFLRLAGLFHDIGKWEVASKECHLAGKLEYNDNNYSIGDFQIAGSRGTRELEYKLRPLIGKEIKILGARLDEYPEIVQFKRVLIGEQMKRGLTYVENGKRHFLNHEKLSSRLLKDILGRYNFAMFFAGAGQKREEDLLKLVENHMQATLVFMPEFRGEQPRRPFRERAAELTWHLCWNGREFDLQNIHDFIHLWKADYIAGKVHSEAQNALFERIVKELAEIGLWQHEHLMKLNWPVFMDYASEQDLAGPRLGRFKDFVRAKAMKEMREELDQIFLQKIYKEFTSRRK